MACEVTTLEHEPWNNSLKAGALITNSFSPVLRAQKFSACPWEFVWKQLKGDVTQELAGGGHVKEHGGSDHGWAVP